MLRGKGRWSSLYLKAMLPAQVTKKEKKNTPTQLPNEWQLSGDQLQ